MPFVRFAPSLALALLAACSPVEATWLMTVHGAVVNQDREPVIGAEVSLVLAEAGDDTGLASGALMGTAVTEDDGRFHAPVLVDDPEASVAIAVSASIDGHRDGLTWTELTLRDAPPAEPLWLGPGQVLQTSNLRLPAVTVVADETESESSWGQGTLYDCEGGDPVPRAQFSLRAGWNAPDDRRVVATGNTDADGVYTVDGLIAGVYTASVEPGSGYTAARFPVLISPAGSADQRAAVVAPPASGEFKACLSWPEPSLDLDLHMTGPLATGGGRFHVYEDAPEHPPREELIAALTYQGDGLESTTVYEIRDDDLYRLSAWDGSAISNDESLPASRALLQVWWGESLLIAAPTPSYSGTLWGALELDPLTGAVYRLQEYATEDDPANHAVF